MSLLGSVGDFFALDIGTTAVRAVQLKPSGSGWNLVKYGTMPVDIKVASSDSVEDQKKLGSVITSLISQTGIRAKDVVLGIPSNKMFATVVDLPDLPPAELANTIKYQAEQYIPMSLDEAKVDWAVLGKSLNDETKNEVLLASVANTFTEARLDMIESLGLNVVAIEPDSLAINRSLVDPNAQHAQVLIDVGDISTDIVIAYAAAPRLIRSIPVGMQSFIKSEMQNLNIQENQASQFLLKFGVQPDRLEGQIVRALEATLEQFSSEVTKSIRFFQTRYPSAQVGALVLSGYGITIPAFADYIGSKTGVPAQAGNPWSKVNMSSADRDKLQQVAAQFAVAVGLAERENRA